jgi:allophanate hydrolase subunit 1
MDSTQQLTREDIRMKLRSKLRGFKNHVPVNKQKVTQKEYDKLINDAKNELTKLQQDERITPEIMLLYKKVNDQFKNIEIPSPLQLLNGPEIGKQKFIEYLSKLIEMCKENNITRERFVKDFLNSDYTNYHIAVLGIEIVPEKLRSDIIYS